MPENQEKRLAILFSEFFKKELSDEDSGKIRKRLALICDELGIEDPDIKRRCLQDIFYLVLIDRLAKRDQTPETEALQAYIHGKLDQDYSHESTNVYYHIEPWLYDQGYRRE
ncbi:MAG: hypothetical protein WCW16_04875 [Candidatus Magasanikbacteria bacterium]